MDNMRVIEVGEDDEELFANDGIRTCDYRENPEEVLSLVSEQIAKFGLEVVIYDQGSDSYIWTIQKK